MQPLKIISDNTENRENIAFGFDAYANAIAELIATNSNKTPFTIGVSGRWGSGKTTLMKEVERLLDEIPEDNNHFRRIKTVWFQAWKYKDEDEILAALLNDIFEKFKNEQGILQSIKGKVIEQAKELPKSINYRKIFSMLSKAAINIDITEFFKEVKPDDPVYKEFLSFYDNFEKEFDEILWELLGTEKDDEKAGLVVFIDDLDRCPLPKIIQILETVKVFMDREGCIFVIGAAKDIIQKALKNEEKYQDEDADKFLEKIVQVEFPLPKKTVENSDTFITEITEKLGIVESIDNDDIGLILPILDFNPRRIIALFNRISLQQSIMRYNKNKIEFKKILFWRVLDLYNGVFFNLIRRDDKFYNSFKTDLEAYLRLSEEDKKVVETVKSKVQEDNLVWVKDEAIQMLFTKMDLAEQEYRQLVSYSQTFQEEDYSPKEGENIYKYCEEMEQKYFQDDRDLKKLIFIKGGQYNLKDIGLKDFSDFYIGKYPVTNGWYNEFISDNGYSNHSFWSKEGEQWLNKQTEFYPAFWSDNIFNHPSKPVVGVSWFEAEAFCNWLTFQDNKKKYRLPDENEWLVTGRGKDNREFAWGNEWNIKYCNNWELKLNKTSVVGIFKDGDTPAGVSDMNGNVWEWCLPDWSRIDRLIGSSDRLVYGGSWTYNSQRSWIGQSSIIDSEKRNNNIGFRVVAVDKKI